MGLVESDHSQEKPKGKGWVGSAPEAALWRGGGCLGGAARAGRKGCPIFQWRRGDFGKEPFEKQSWLNSILDTLKGPLPPDKHI